MEQTTGLFCEVMFSRFRASAKLKNRSKPQYKTRYGGMFRTRGYAKTTFGSNKILLRATLRKKLRLGNQSSSELCDPNKSLCRNKWENHLEAKVRTYIRMRKD